MKSVRFHRFISIIFFAAACLLTVLFLLHAAGSAGTLFENLYQRIQTVMLGTLWLLPAYLFFLGFLFTMTDDEHPYGILFPFTLIPYITFILFLQSSLPNSTGNVLSGLRGMIPGDSITLVILFIFILECLLFIIWSRNWFSREQNDHSRNYVLGPMHQEAAERPAASLIREEPLVTPEIGSDDDHRQRGLTLSFPVLPDLPHISTIQPVSEPSPVEKEFKDEEQRPVPRKRHIAEADSSAVAEDALEVLEVEEPLQAVEAEPEEPVVCPDSIPLPQIQGRLKEIQLESAPDIETIRVGSHDIPVMPEEDADFSNRPAEQESIDFTGKIIKSIPSRMHGEPGPSVRNIGYTTPSEDVLDVYPDASSEVDSLTEIAGETLMKTLKEFKIDAQLTGVQKGPVVTMYEILPAPGIRVQAITNLTDNIALQLAASRVRIVAPIPGKQAVGIEVPNKKRSIVSFREMLSAVHKKPNYEIPVVLGKDITGGLQVIDLTKTPHLLIAGATGSGKSVCVNSLICSILYNRSPRDVRLLMVDPKIVELKLYNHIPHLLTPVITDSKKAIKALKYCIYEMERRYELLDQLNVRDVKTYNRRIREQQLAKEKLPYIVLIIDEFADLMTTTGKEMETYLARIAAMARAVGIHLVLATQRPSTNVITGIIKANIPSRIAFMVTSNTDSRIILDQAGAEKLLGRGDMLFASSWDPNLERLQGAFLSEEEVERIVFEVRKNGEPDYLDEELFWDEEDEEDFDEGFDEEESGDPLMDEALKIVYARKSASASYLQRRLKIGYNRAARLIEEMEDRGIVGPARGSQPREILRMSDPD